jgi:hypothetical protein
MDRTHLLKHPAGTASAPAEAKPSNGSARTGVRSIGAHHYELPIVRPRPLPAPRQSSEW